MRRLPQWHATKRLASRLQLLNNIELHQLSHEQYTAIQFRQHTKGSFKVSSSFHLQKRIHSLFQPRRRFFNNSLLVLVIW